MPKHAFSAPVIWVLFAFLGFAFLPVTALDYGLLGATRSEWLAAMGWSSVHLSWAWFLPLFAFLFPNQTACQRQARWSLFGLGLLCLFIVLSAAWFNLRLGYAVFVLIVALIGLATHQLAILNVMRGDHFLIAALLSVVALVGVFMVYPILSIFTPMLFQDGNFAPSQILSLLQKPYVAKVVKNSFAVAGTVGLLSTLLGLIFALYTTRIAKRTAFIGRVFSILPIVTPPFVVGLGVTLMLGRSGYLTGFLAEQFGLSRNWLYGFNGIVISHTLALTPIAFMIIEGALKSLNASLEEAAYTLRANRYQAFFSVILPLLKPALANAFLVVAIQSLADFSTPFVLGGNFDVIATQIYFFIAGTHADYASASTLGSLLLLFSLTIFLLQYYWIGQRRYTTVSGKSARSNHTPLASGLKWPIICTMLLWVALNALLYGSIFYGSFTQNWGVNHTLTLDNYLRLFGQGVNNGAFPSLIHTVIFAAAAAPITAFFGLLIAYLTVKREFKGKRTLEFLTLLCFAVPGTVAGVAYILAFNHAPITLTGSAIIMVLSMVMRNMPVGMRAAVAGLEQIDKSLGEASLSLKAGSWQTLRYVIFPLLKPAILSALVTSFVRAMTTVSAIIFLVTADTRVATSYMLNRVEDGEYGLAVAYGSILIIVMMSVILWFDWLMRDKRRMI